MEASGEFQASVSLPRGKKVLGTHWIGGWMDPMAGMDAVEKKKLLLMPGIELRFLLRRARNPTIYRLSYNTQRRAQLTKLLIMQFSGILYGNLFKFYVAYEKTDRSEPLRNIINLHVTLIPKHKIHYIPNSSSFVAFLIARSLKQSTEA
jgi:hypothetical protein